jgi:hypothetical protein
LQLWGDIILEHLQNTNRKLRRLRSGSLFAMIAPNFVPMTCLSTIKIRMIQISTVRTLSPTLLFLALGVAIAQPRSGDWLTVSRNNLCVTQGVIEKTSANRLSVNVSKMRAYVNAWTAQSAEIRFTYLGGTRQQSALGSGQMRRQFGLKLHAQDACNLVYAIWRILPESKFVVSVKRNLDAHSSSECGNRGYVTIKPRKASAVPSLQAGESHVLRAEMKNSELRIYVDDREVWQGDVGSQAAQLVGPVGIRSDNAQLEFDLMAREYEGAHPDYVRACKTGATDSD